MESLSTNSVKVGTINASSVTAASNLTGINPDTASEGDSQTNSSGPVLYSPTFQCYTTLPFYAALLSELQAIANKIDLCPPLARDIVWKQLFTLVGVNNKCEYSFSPILQAWLSSPTVNLLAIELLYLSFALSLVKFPDLISPTANLESRQVDKDLNPETVAYLSKTFLASGSMMSAMAPPPSSTHENIVLSTPSLNPPALSPSKQRLREAIRARPKHSQSAEIDLTGEGTPPRQPSPPRQNNGALKRKEPEASQNNVGSGRGRKRLAPAPAPDPAPHFLNTTTQAAQMLLMLREWSTQLDRLSDASKQLLWNTCKLLTPLPSLDENFRTIFTYWSKDYQEHTNQIIALFSSIGYLRVHGFIGEDFYVGSLPVFHGRGYSPDLKTFPLVNLDQYLPIIRAMAEVLEPSYPRSRPATSSVTSSSSVPEAASQHSNLPEGTSQHSNLHEDASQHSKHQEATLEKQVSEEDEKKSPSRNEQEINEERKSDQQSKEASEKQSQPVMDVSALN